MTLPGKEMHHDVTTVVSESGTEAGIAGGTKEEVGITKPIDNVIKEMEKVSRHFGRRCRSCSQTSFD